MLRRLISLIKPLSVALGKFGEWVCARRSGSAFSRRAAALWQNRSTADDKEQLISSHPPASRSPTLTPFGETKTVLTKNTGYIIDKFRRLVN